MSLQKNIDDNDSDFVKGVKDLINKNIQTYQINDSRITSDYGGEVGTTKSYNGRQLLELLQNADDEDTDEVLIELDTKENTLTVSNNGSPFTVSGIASLMIANNSDKKSRKREIIGNKGLGFRSILNWTDKIEIIRKDITLEFSPAIAKDYFEKIVSDKERRAELKKKEPPPKGQVPFAVLAIPELKENKGDKFNWETSIKLHYKDDGNTKETNPDQPQSLVPSTEESIRIQLGSLKPEILLFLNSIKEIKYSIDGQPTIIENPDKTKEKKSQIVINESKWSIKDTGNKLLEKNQEKYYNIKVAWKDDLSDKDTNFFTYFPTQVPIHLPCIIHASFDLDPTRNHINNLPENITVLEEVVNVLCGLAENELKTPGKSDWLSYRLLTPTSNSENIFLKTNFFEKLALKKKGLEIYPSVDGNYYSLEKVVYYGEDFSNWVQNNGFGKSFPGLLLPNEEQLNLNKHHFPFKFSLEEFQSIIEQISPQIKTIDERVELIRFLTESEFEDYHDNQYPLLLDTNKALIPEQTQVFTLERGSVDKYSIPDFSKLTFIDNSLLEKLYEEFSDDIKEDKNKEEHRSRKLKRILDPIIYIGSNDINDVAKNLVSSLNSFIENFESTDKSISKNDAIDRIVFSLFTIFIENESREGVLPSPISLCNRAEQISKCNNLFLGNEYPSGQITESIFEGIYTSNDYVNGKYRGLLEVVEGIEAATIENFLLWLGVNKHVRFKTIDVPNEHNIDFDYINYVFKKLNKDIPKYSGFNFKGLEIYDVAKTVAKLSCEKLILLIHKEARIKQRLDIWNLEDPLKYSYIHWFDIYPKPSYINYQLSKFFNFEDYLIDNNNLDFVNKISVNNSEPLFQKYNVCERDVNQVLLLLGAKNSISEMRPDRIYEILRDYEALENEGKTTQLFYKQALNILEKKDYSPSEKQKNGLRVYAKSSDKKKGSWLPADKVYYSNNTVLPASILKNKYILNVPKRFGEEKVKNYLGVNLFSEFELELIPNSIIVNERLTKELMEELDALRPFFLGYRLKELSGVSIQKDAASQLKSYRVFIVRAGSYKTKEDPEVFLKTNEFIRKDNDYFLCIDKDSTISLLKNNPLFCDAIAEILCLVCKVWDHREQFWFAIKYGTKQLEHQFETSGEDQSLIVARELLGISTYEITFWRAIYVLQNIQYIEGVYDEKQLEKKLNSDLGILLNNNYNKVDFENFDNRESFEFLKWLCSVKGCTLSQIKQNLPSFHGIKDWHTQQFSNWSFELVADFSKAVWLLLSKKDISEQSNFESIKNGYKIFIQESINELSSSNSWSFDINYKELLIDKLNNKYSININDDKLAAVSIDNFYQSLLKESNVEWDQLSDADKSLFYFQEHEELLRGKLDKYKSNLDDNDATTDDTPDDEASDILEASFEGKIAPALKGKTGKVFPSSVYDPKKGDRQKKAGKGAEKLVYKSLKKKYPNGKIQWLSGNSEQVGVIKDDTLGYDFRYTKENSENWFFLEVKSVSNDSFIISAFEVYTAFENKGKYHLGLVKDKKIFIDEGFFEKKEWQSNFDQLRTASFVRPLDYEVFFEFPTKEDKHLQENEMPEKADNKKQ